MFALGWSRGGEDSTKFTTIFSGQVRWVNRKWQLVPELSTKALIVHDSWNALIVTASHLSSEPWDQAQFLSHEPVDRPWLDDDLRRWKNLSHAFDVFPSVIATRDRDRCKIGVEMVVARHLGRQKKKGRIYVQKIFMKNNQKPASSDDGTGKASAITR